MTWEEYNAAVRVHLHVHNRRQGIQDFIDALIIAGCLDLQEAIPGLQTGHKDTYAAADMESDDGWAQIGILPAGKVYQMRRVRWDTDAGAIDDAAFIPLNQVSWDRFFSMKAGLESQNLGLVAVDPRGRNFAIHPQLNAESRLVIEWDGIKSDFDDDDDVPFTERTAEVNAQYVLRTLYSEIDKDPDLAGIADRLFTTGKRKHYSWWNERKHITNQRTDAQLVKDTTEDA